MKEIADTIEAAEKYAVRCVDVPPLAKYEIRWATRSPDSSEDEQVLDGFQSGYGPMLVASLTD